MQGIDGWRLDVPNEIDDDSFWAEFRRIVKETNPDAYLCGEIWDGNPRWVGDDHFDGLMDYPVRSLILDLLSEKSKSQKFIHDLMEGFYKYPQENSLSMYVLLGSHDTERYFTMVGRDVSRAKLGFLIQFAFPGAPAIYYGDENGMEGGKDPDCRRAFNWDESTWNTDLHQWVKMLAGVRKHSGSPAEGHFEHTDHRGWQWGVCLAEGCRVSKSCPAWKCFSFSPKVMLDLTQMAWKTSCDQKSHLP